MNASNSVIGKLQLTLGLSKGSNSLSNDTLALTRLSWGLVFRCNFPPFHYYTRNFYSIVFYSFTEMNYWNFLRMKSQFSVCCGLKSLHCSCFQLRHYLCLLLPTKLFLHLVLHQFLVSSLHVGVYSIIKDNTVTAKQYHLCVHKFTWSGGINSSWWLLLTL